MAPISITRTYKSKSVKNKLRPWKNICNVVKTKEDIDSVFDALYVKNLKKQNCLNQRNLKNTGKENKPIVKESPRKVHIITPSGSSDDTSLDTTFDRILKIPSLQHTKPQQTNEHKSSEYDTSSSDFKNSVSDPSFLSDSSIPLSIKPTRKPWKVTRQEKGQSKCSVAKLVRLQNNVSIDSSLEANPMCKRTPLAPQGTSTPKGQNMKGNNKTKPFLSPILRNKRTWRRNNSNRLVKESPPFSPFSSFKKPQETDALQDSSQSFVDQPTSKRNPSIITITESSDEVSAVEAYDNTIPDSVSEALPLNNRLSGLIYSVNNLSVNLKQIHTSDFNDKSQTKESALNMDVCLSEKITLHTRRNIHVKELNSSVTKLGTNAIPSSTTTDLGVSNEYSSLSEEECNTKPRDESVILFDSWNSTDHDISNTETKDLQEVTTSIASLTSNDCTSSKNQNSLNIALATDENVLSCTNAKEVLVQPVDNDQVSQDPEIQNLSDVPLICFKKASIIKLQSEMNCQDALTETTGSCFGWCTEERRLVGSSYFEKKRRESSKRLSCRRLSHVVIPVHAGAESEARSPSFRDLYSKYAAETLAPLNHVAEVIHEENEESLISIAETESESEIDINLLSSSVSKVSSVFTARDAVLQRCHQSNPIPFSEAYTSSYWTTCRKIGEGVYGEVFLSEEEDSSVLKIIPIEGEDLVNGEPQKKFDEILSEIVIAMELSDLRYDVENRTSGFSELKRCLCVQGEYPEELINLWNDYDENKGSENDSPTMFTKDQLYIILELANGGTDLEGYEFTSAEQSHSIFIQTAYALAVAEQAFEFEHRDLHWGNVLISPTTEKVVTYSLCGKPYVIPTKGVQVTIIDFTLSRITYDGCCIFNDLSRDQSLFTAEGDYQFEIYRQMQKHTLDVWNKFVPYTNLLWLHYLVDKMCKMVSYSKKSSKVHKRGLAMLQKLEKEILDYSSAIDFVVKKVL